MGGLEQGSYSSATAVAQLIETTGAACSCTSCDYRMHYGASYARSQARTLLRRLLVDHLRLRLSGWVLLPIARLLVVVLRSGSNRVHIPKL
ncbi:hypothetical protein PMAYCL1PPCAC_32190, partial [Pristionchus mayeri]